MYSLTHQKWNPEQEDYDHITIMRDVQPEEVTAYLVRHALTAHQYYVTEWEEEEILAQTNGDEWLDVCRAQLESQPFVA